MGLPLPEYRVLRPLRESARSCVYEAVRERDGHAVIAKVFDLVGEADEDRVHREFELIRGLEIDGVVRGLDLLRVGDQLVMLLERVPGQNLAEYTRGQPLALPRFWPLAIQLADILGRIHGARVVHRDIKPTNILINPETGKVHIADFGISVLLEQERRHIYDSEVFVGTLPYISPEQTGRTSRSVDFRSDLYSLGVTLYELLTGCRPFDHLTPLDLIHAHLAREPDPPIVLRSDLPLSLSRLVMKLLAKAPEHRYQSAAGLAADLRRLEAAAASGNNRPIPLGTDDVVTSLGLPHQLYGRERERRELLDAFAAVVRSTSRRTILLTGPVGIGKSALAAELAAAVTGRGGYLIRGEFGEGSPHSGIGRAFAALFEQLLTESDARLERWRRLLLGGLGNLAAVIAELSPSFELIVGRQSSTNSLDGIELGNRLAVAVERLLAVVCASGPLVLVLDDLQHAGLGALRVIEGLVNGEHGPLLVVMTLRDDDLAADHPLQGWFAELELRSEATGDDRFRHVALGELPLGAIEDLLADTLPGATGIRSLAQAIARRTNGVPLFIRQMIRQLFERGILQPTPRGWTWDLPAIEAEPLPADAVALMRNKLGLLEDETRDVIARAACVGARFEVGRLAAVCELPRERLGAMLVELEDLGMLLRAGGGYRFAHDSIRTAAYASLDPEIRQQLHWQLGSELRTHIGASDERLFDVVDHLDAGAPSTLDLAERRELASLDLRAGQRALVNGAHDLARRYLSRGIEHLGQDSSAAVRERGPAAPDYELVFGLHFALGETLSLARLRSRADTAFTELLSWPLEPRHHAEVVARRLESLWAETRNDEALTFGLEALARLDSPVPRSLGRDEAMLLLNRAWTHWRGYDRQALAELPWCSDELQAGVIDVVAQLKYAAFAVDNTLFLYLVGLHAELLATHGLHLSTAKALVDLAIGVSGALGQVVDAVELQELGCELATRGGQSPSQARLLAISGVLTLHRARPFADILARFEPAYVQALETGEPDSAGYLGAFGVDMQLELGTHLAVLDRRCRTIAGEVGRWCPKPMSELLYLLRGVCRRLSAGEIADADADLIWDGDPERVRDHDGWPSAHILAQVTAAMLQLIEGEASAALTTCLALAETADVALFNTVYVARTWVVLVAAHAIVRLDGGEVPAGAAQASERALEGLTRWAESAPANYGHYLDFALGLRQALAGRPEAATAHLDRAWNGARQCGCRWIEGLAAEQLAAQFQRQGLRAPVDGVLRRAWEAFAAWGAERKLALLRAAHPGVFIESTRRSRGEGEGPADPTPSSNVLGQRPAIDLARVLRSVGSISEDLRLDEVISRVLDAALTNVGADHGLLVLDQGGELALVAEAHSVDDRQLYADAIPLRDVGSRAPAGLINFVARTGRAVVLDDVREDLRFAGDPYLEESEVRSILALPLLKGDRRLGVLVLENHLTTHGFIADSIEALRLITNQAASTLENAQLYTQLRRSEARWRSLVDGAPDLIALIDERGAVVFRNHPGPLRGIDETNEPNDGDGELEPESARRWREAVNDVLRQGERVEIELAYRFADGPLRWYGVRIAPIELHRGLGERRRVPRRNAVVVATDITERKHAEVEKRDLESQLRQQQRLESVGTLASGVAHEINNPIQGIMNYADLILANPSDREIVEDFASEINHEAHRVAKIVRNLLAFSRQQDASELPEANHLADVVEASLSLIRTVLRSDHVEVSLDADPSVPPVRCRAQQIQQIVLNLVTNARDALNQRYGDYHDDKRIVLEISRAPRDGWVRLAVRDFGTGIPPEVLPRIFDPFFTTKGRDQGTGLGLAVSHGLAIEHGGELSVETTPGEGTCFMLDLPASSG